MASADLVRVEPQNLRRKSTAAIEWRTIPPTIKVRHKKRPPPITIHSKRSFEQLVWTPGPPSNSATATTASSATIFTPLTYSAPTSTFVREFSKSATVGQDPRTLYYAIPGFQQSPNGPNDIRVPAWPLSADRSVPLVGKTPLEVVTELESVPVGKDALDFREAAPSPPLSPSVYLTLHPWTLPEYLLLLSIKPLYGKTDDVCWEEIARKLNEATTHQPRSAWDCWHRWAVSWCRPQQTIIPRPNTYPHAPGVQHEYKFSDLEGLIELWTSLSSAMGSPHGLAMPLAFPGPTTAAVQPRRAAGRAYHPAYPPPSAPPNVPMRSLGDPRERGLAAWFNMSAVSTPVLQLMLDGQLERADDWLPVHLRGRTAPPPPPRPLGETSVPR
ncbi:hypothetical protein BJV78DRAFT_1286959 [Lactifluus subvellereus]|nr:hypothetical protein BJV78DRAFT_1286959 [Lactifluus subvellereus]